MSKVQFIQSVESLFASNEVSQEVREYFEKTVKAKKVNKKEVEKAKIVKQAIHDFLKANSGKVFNRNEIGDALWNNADIDEKHLVNDKGDGVAYNSITAYANQLVTLGLVLKAEQKVGKAKKIVYTSR